MLLQPVALGDLLRCVKNVFAILQGLGSVGVRSY